MYHGGTILVNVYQAVYLGKAPNMKSKYISWSDDYPIHEFINFVGGMIRWKLFHDFTNQMYIIWQISDKYFVSSMRSVTSA